MFARPRRGTTRTILLALAAGLLLFGGSSLVGEARSLMLAAPTLGAASSFAVLGASTVTNTGATTVDGELGVSPGSAVTGFPPGTVVDGSIHAADALAAQAQADTTIAYNGLTGQPCNFDLTGQNLGGKTLTAGVYCFSSSAQLTGPLTLDAQGHADATFVFKIGSTLTTASGSSILLINGGSPCNVFWQVGSSATLGTTTTFLGNILALTSITLNTGATVSGRALARNGAVTMDTNTISSACSAGVATATPTATPTGTITPVATPTATPTRTPIPPAYAPCPVLDTFNRASGRVGANWTGATDTGTYRILGDQLQSRASGYIYWNPTSFGADQEACVTFWRVSRGADDQDLLLKVNGIAPDGGAGGTAAGNNWSVIDVQYDAVHGLVLVNTHVPYTTARPQWVTHASFPVALNVLTTGDQLTARALPDGTVEVFVDGVLVGSTNVTQGPNPFPTTLAAGGGRIGLWVIGATSADPSVMDDFGGGTVTP